MALSFILIYSLFTFFSCYESCTLYGYIFYDSIKKEENKEDFLGMIDIDGLCDSNGIAKDRAL